MIRTWGHLSLGFKLIFLQSVLLMVTTASLSWSLVRRFEASLSDRTFKQLQSIRTLKRQRIELALARILSTAQVAIDEVRIHSDTHEKLETILKRMPFRYQWADIQWLEDPMAIPSGASCRNQATNQDRPFLCDSPPGQATGDGKETEGLYVWVVVQKPYRVGILIRLNEVESILETREGMGDTGQSYIIDHSLKIRTPIKQDSHLFSNSGTDSATLGQMKTTRDGERVLWKLDGEKALTSYTGINHQDLDWILISQMDEAEALHISIETKKAFLPVVTLALLVSILAAYTFSRRIIQSNRASENKSWLAGQETERSRIAAEIHDGLGQLITWTSLKISASELATSARGELQAALTKIQEELRRVVQDLTPLSLKDLGLLRAVESLIQDFQRNTGCKVQFKVANDFDEDLLSPFTQLQTYRIIQECLNNATKHAGATSISIVIAKSRRGLHIQVEDDGKGFDRKVLSEPYPERRLRSLNQRTSLLAGRMTLGISAANGAQLDFDLPMGEL